MTHRPRIPAAVWALGLVSLLMDVSSELVHSLLPVFLVTALGASALVVGLIEGAAEATALIVKVFSGVLSDYWGRRKPLAVLGYGLGALSKPLFALATSSGLVLAARLIDRVGKGIRGAPRDALVADVTPPAIRGAAFGLRQALDTVGAFLGPVLAMGLMLLWADDFRAVFWVAIVPGFLAVAVLLFGVQEPEKDRAAQPVNPVQRAQLRRLPAAYWQVVGFGALFMLARFSEACPAGADRHERRLRAGSLSVRPPVGPGIALPAVGARAGHADRRRPLPRGQQRLDLGVGRHQPLGVAPRHDAGAAGHHGRGHGTKRPARYRLRVLQSRKRTRPAGGQCPGRVAVGPARCGHDLPHGRRAQPAGDRRGAGVPRRPPVSG
jgi:hypothetical protein